MSDLVVFKRKDELQRRIGSGGMGMVSHVQHLLVQRPVAVKVMAASPNTPTAVERFLRGARTLASLRHPAVCSIFDVDTTDERKGRRAPRRQPFDDRWHAPRNPDHL
jgi:serine/threonine protein kinase